MAQPLSVGSHCFNKYSIHSLGFSLLEVMLSAVILTVSLLGVAGMYGFSSQFSYEAKQYSSAVNISKHVLDGIKINKKAWSELLLLEKNTSKIKVTIDNKMNNKINSNQSSFVAIDTKSFQEHLNSAFPDGNACIVIEFKKKDISNIMNIGINVNWHVGAATSNENVCDINGSDTSNKNYHVSAVI